MKTINNLTFQQLFQKYFVTSSLQNQIPLIYNSEMNKDRLLMHSLKITPSLTVAESAKFEFINQLYKYQTNLTSQRSIDQKFASAKPSETDEQIIDGYKAELTLAKFKQKNLDQLVPAELKPENELDFLGVYHSQTSKNSVQELRSHFFGLSDDDRRGHILISGNAGFGKSTMMKNLFLQDALRGFGGVMIDNDRNTINEILAKIPTHRAKDVIYLKPGDPNLTFGIELFDGQNEYTVVETVIDIFKNIWQGEQTDKISYFLEPILYLILKNKEIAKFSDYHKIIFDADFRNQLLPQCSDVKILNFWNNYTKNDQIEMQSTLIKLDSINRNQVIRQVLDNPDKFIKISHILCQDKLLVVDLSELPDGNVSSRFIGNLILKKVAQLAGEYNRTDSKLFSVFADEFWGFSGQDMFTKVSGLRKNNISLVFSQQGTYNKEEKIDVGTTTFGSFVNKIVFNTSDPYSKFMNHELELRIDDTVKNLPKLTCLFEGIINGYPINPILIDVIPTMFEGTNDNFEFFNQSNNFFSKTIVKLEVDPDDEKQNIVEYRAEMEPKSDAELRAIVAELERAVKFNPDGTKRKNKVSTTKRRSMDNKKAVIKRLLSDRAEGVA